MDRLLIGQLFSSKLFSVRCPKWRVQLPELAHNLGGKGAGEGGGGGEERGGGGVEGGGGEKKATIKV